MPGVTGNSSHHTITLSNEVVEAGMVPGLRVQFFFWKLVIWLPAAEKTGGKQYCNQL